MTYQITYSDGRRTSVETYESALTLLRTAGCAVIGHSGDLLDGGDRTLAWRTEADAENDAGARAFAVIRSV